MFPGFPGGDMSALQGLLNDPSIKEMAEQIAQDPSFRSMAESLQQQMGGMMGGPGAAPQMPGPEGMEGMMNAYMSAMQNLMSNPNVVQMVERIGSQMMADPQMASMMATMQNPQAAEDIKARMEALKEDPELRPILEELERDGPQAMMKFWNDPETLSKLGKAFHESMGPGGSPFDLSSLNKALEGKEEEEEEEIVEPELHTAAMEGDVAKLKELLGAEGADANLKDEEGRTALHFAAGYGELDCMEVLLGKGANVEEVDQDKNTALHYAAGYGQAEACAKLIEKKAKLDALNADGNTPLQVAKLNNMDDVVKVLEKAK